MIRILLVDDQNLFREGLATLLSVHEDLCVVGEAVDGEEAVAQVEALGPDVVLMDLRMPKMGGAAATRAILERESSTGEMPKILVLTTFDDDEDVFDALRAGAAGYLLKDAPSERLVEAIRAVARGEPVLAPAITAKVLAGIKRLDSPPVEAGSAGPPEDLSERERDILRLLAQGLSNRAIAERLHLAEGTVKNYVTSILAKLDVSDRTRAALKAREMGWV